MYFCFAYHPDYITHEERVITKIKQLVWLFVVVVMLFSIFPSTFAATIENDGAADTSSYQPVCFDEYSTRTWTSLAEAKKYYGYDFTYIPCSHYYNGSYYNYYYEYSGNSKMYFFVSLDDGNDVWSISENEAESS
jgi:hypothetical protein